MQLNRWSVVCGYVLHRVQRGEVWCVSSTLCRYDITMGLLLVRIWARVRRVSLGRESLLWLKRARRDPCKTTRPIHLVKLFTDSSNTANL